MRIIDADELKALRELYIQGKLQFIGNEYDLIDKCPTIEAEPVRHGRWIKTDYFDAHKIPIYQCSVCSKEVADHYIKCHKYCLHCGAKMDLED